ncbi:MAG: hypothetical protein R3301_00075 [Saprospiraceae bacterium]|nr:hypothetical protein [Saprospiraceae bacterium]
MKPLVTLLAICVLTILLSGYGPWWIVALIPFVAVLLARLKPAAGFVVGLSGIFVAWAVMAGWIDSQNHSILSQRIGTLLGGLSPVLLILVTALIGGLVGGLAGLTGAYAGNEVRKRRSP